MSQIEELFGLYVTDVRYGVRGQGKPHSVAEDRLRALLNKKLTKAIIDDAESLLIDTIADYELQGFVNGFRYATSIWKEC